MIYTVPFLARVLLLIGDRQMHSDLSGDEEGWDPAAREEFALIHLLSVCGCTARRQAPIANAILAVGPIMLV
jgi:hypothetical protein